MRLKLCIVIYRRNDMTQKIWTKPSLQAIAIHTAQAGQFNSSDNKMTHKS